MGNQVQYSKSNNGHFPNRNTNTHAIFKIPGSRRQCWDLAVPDARKVARHQVMKEHGLSGPWTKLHWSNIRAPEDFQKHVSFIYFAISFYFRRFGFFEYRQSAPTWVPEQFWGYGQTLFNFQKHFETSIFTTSRIVVHFCKSLRSVSNVHNMVIEILGRGWLCSLWPNAVIEVLGS